MNLRNFIDKSIIAVSTWLTYALYFAKRHHKKALFFVLSLLFFASSVSVCIQLQYPKNHALPGTWLANGLVSTTDDDAVNDKLTALSLTPIKIKLGDRTYDATPLEAGITYNTEANKQRVLDYSFKQRLIPFSIFFQKKAFVQKQLQVAVHTTSMQIFTSQLAAAGSIPTVEGDLSVKKGVVSEQVPQPGVAYRAEDIATALHGLSGTPPEVISIASRPAPPTYTTDTIHAAAETARSDIKPLDVVIKGKTYTAPLETVGDWVRFTPDPSSKTIAISFDNAGIKSFLDGVAKQVYQPSTTSQPGTYLDVNAATSNVVSALTKQQSSVTLNVATTPINYTRRFTSTNTGLQGLLDNWVAAHGGVTWGISIRELGGQGRSANYNATSNFTLASVYKLYVSYSVQRRISAGSLSPSAVTTTGKTIDACLDAMIINSDNPCGEALGDLVGWGTITNEARAAGFSGTNLNTTSIYSTPADTALFLQKLNDGNLLDSTQTATLLNRMKRQVYRSGLPLGSKGATVADKVGFIYGYLNDAGIIYYPDSTYVVSVFSIGGSWTQVADLAATVHDYMSTH
jgi:beta-lactamase class A